MIISNEDKDQFFGSSLPPLLACLIFLFSRKMLLYTDIISGDEMFSDAFPVSVSLLISHLIAILIDFIKTIEK
jgi:Translationally controlled tumour protein